MSTYVGYILQTEDGQNSDILRNEMYHILLRGSDPFIGNPLGRLFVIFHDNITIKILIPKSESDSHYIRGVRNAKRITFKELITELWMCGFISEIYNLEV